MVQVYIDGLSADIVVCLDSLPLKHEGAFDVIDVVEGTTVDDMMVQLFHCDSLHLKVEVLLLLLGRFVTESLGAY